MHAMHVGVVLIRCQLLKTKDILVVNLFGLPSRFLGQTTWNQSQTNVSVQCTINTKRLKCEDETHTTFFVSRL